MSSVLPSLCEDLRNFLMNFVFITAESVRATQGQRGIMIMSVDMGSRLWNEMEAGFSECDIRDLKPEGRIICFLEGLKKMGIIEDACRPIDHSGRDRARPQLWCIHAHLQSVSA